MGFELPDGKTARNIQEQVAFLTEKVKELFAAVSELGFKVVKVDVLPEEGAARTIYLVPSSDPETENIYDEYIWTEDGWEKIGSTDIDLSDYYTKEEANDLVIANPVLSGTEAPLESIEINNTKYKIPEAKSIYFHNIRLTEGSLELKISIYTSSNTPFDLNSLIAYLSDNNINSSSKGLGVIGKYRSGSSNYLTGLLFYYSNTNLRVYMYQIYASAPSAVNVDITTAATITDTVIAL